MNYRGGMWEGGGGQDGVEWGGKWDDCNSIINKYILKKYVKWLTFMEYFESILLYIHGNDNSFHTDILLVCIVYH